MIILGLATLLNAIGITNIFNQNDIVEDIIKRRNFNIEDYLSTLRNMTMNYSWYRDYEGERDQAIVDSEEIFFGQEITLLRKVFIFGSDEVSLRSVKLLIRTHNANDLSKNIIKYIDEVEDKVETTFTYHIDLIHFSVVTISCDKNISTL